MGIYLFMVLSFPLPNWCAINVNFHVLTHIYTQMDQNLDDSVMSLTDYHPYITMMIGGSSVQLQNVVSLRP